MRRTVFAAIALTTLLACEPVLEPEVSVDVSSPAFAKGRVAQSVTGHGSFIFRGFNRTFSFTARMHVDGSVDGQWQRVTHTGGPVISRSHGKITCFTIIGNQAWIGGFKTISTTGGLDPPINGVIWSVVDNGEGSNAQVDQMSTQGILRSPEAVAAHCADTPAFTLNDLVTGNIQVRD